MISRCAAVITTTLLLVIVAVLAASFSQGHLQRNLATVPCSPGGPSRAVPGGWTTYQNLEYDFSVDYPAAWMVTTSSDSQGYDFTFHDMGHTKGILVTFWISNGGYGTNSYKRPYTEEEVLSFLYGPGEGAGPLPIVASSEIQVGDGIDATHYSIQYEPNSNLDMIVFARDGVVISFEVGNVTSAERSEFISSFGFVVCSEAATSQG